MNRRPTGPPAPTREALAADDDDMTIRLSGSGAPTIANSPATRGPRGLPHRSAMLRAIPGATPNRVGDARKSWRRRTTPRLVGTPPGVLHVQVPLVRCEEATVAVTADVTLDQLWHAVPAFPTAAEIWLKLLHECGL